MRKIYFLLTLMLLATASAWSQAGRITGHVADPQNQAVSYATVAVKGTNIASSADENGNFIINAPNGATLIVTATGFRSTEVRVADQSRLSITLLAGQALNEVVVTALGISRQTKSLGYSAQQ